MHKKMQLGEIFIKAGIINELQLARALGDQKQWGGRLGSILVRMGYITEDDLAAVLEQQMGVKWLSLKDLTISDDAIRVVKKDIAKKYFIVPVAYDGKVVTLAMPDPNDLRSVDTLEFVLGKRIRPVIATKGDIEWAITKYYEKTAIEEGEKIPLYKEPEIVVEEDISVLFQSLVELLFEKGLLTKEEFACRVRDKKRISARNSLKE